MTKVLIAVLSLALLGSGVLVGVAGGLDGDPARSVSLPVGTTDETTTGTTTDDAGDVSGPCDEAEHRDDPRCTGAAGGDDNSGPGSGDDETDDNDDDDRSGSNSGRG